MTIRPVEAAQFHADSGTERHEEYEKRFSPYFESAKKLFQDTIMGDGDWHGTGNGLVWIGHGTGNGLVWIGHGTGNGLVWIGQGTGNGLVWIGQGTGNWLVWMCGTRHTSTSRLILNSVRIVHNTRHAVTAPI